MATWQNVIYGKPVIPTFGKNNKWLLLTVLLHHTFSSPHMQLKNCNIIIESPLFAEGEDPHKNIDSQSGP